MKEESGMITFEIQFQEAGKEKRTLSFMTEKNLPLRRVFLDFCDQLGLVYGSIRFVQCDGCQIKESQTPEECEIEDGDVIDAFSEQLGEMKDENGMITFQIQIQEAGIGCRKLSFTTEKTLPLCRVFSNFCHQLNLVYGTIRFVHEGVLINEEKTAEEARFEDGDVIDAFHDCSITFQILYWEVAITTNGGEGGRKLSFTTWKSLPLRRVFLDLCDQVGLRYGTITFIGRDGHRINENQSAEECEIKDGDLIYAFHMLTDG